MKNINIKKMCPRSLRRCSALFIRTLAWLGFVAYGKKKKTDWERDGLKGKVKSLRLDAYEAVEKSGKLEKGSKKNMRNIDKESVVSHPSSFSRPNFSSANHLITYDASGNKIEMNNYDKDGALERKLTYQYDEWGNKIEENSYDKDGALEVKIIYTYDALGKVTGMNVYDKNGALKYKETYKYDASGKLIEWNVYDKNGVFVGKEAYKYTYDHQGNWIKRIEYENNQPQTIIERTIEYFD